MCYVCPFCNRFKGSDIASLDPAGGSLTRLYNPRTDRWEEHFQAVAGAIHPLTAIGRATTRTLKLNLPARVEVRKILTLVGRYPRPESR